MRSILSLLLVGGFCAVWGQPARAEEKVGFQRHQLDASFRSEGVAVGDFNRDGKPDIAAGFVWYESPDWKMHVIAAKPPGPPGALLGEPPHFEPKGYSNSFCNFAEDLNHDGWIDLIVIDFPGRETWWFENPKQADTPWPVHVCVPVTNNESPQYADIDGDGRRELIAAFSPDPAKPDGPDRQMAIFRPATDPTAPWVRTEISVKAAPGTQRYAHGLGTGDLNADGRLDILCAEGWWEAPADRQGLWPFHAAPFGGKAADILVYDFDGDGDQDVLTSSPHAYGVWWHERVASGNGSDAWKTHEIDMTFSQNHAVCLADINGDGLPDFVTGKRWWAHAAGDPGVDEPAVFNWFELKREGGRPHWTRHQFDHNSGPGTQFQVADVNGDGRLDIVTSNKKGVHYFQQVRE
ncbi:MAG: FG-GAP repeat domain-containing protein [Pirellulaceae bacterium]